MAHYYNKALKTYLERPKKLYLCQANLTIPEKMDFLDFKLRFEKKPVEEYPHQVIGNPKVSVCVQVYNQKEFIFECLENILIQKTNFPFEIILGEDGSDDGSREICIDYAKKYPDKIRLLLHQKENKIKIEGNNTGLFNSIFNIFSAKGKYIAYCDGDDFWSDPGKLQQQVKFLEKNNKFVLTYHKAALIDKEGNLLKNNNLFDLTKRDFSSEELKKAIAQPVISTWCFRNIIKKIPIELTRTINADNFWISLLGSYGEGKYLKEIRPSNYRIHNRGIWSLINRDKQLISKMNTYKNLSAYYSRSGNDHLEKFFKRRAENHCKMIIYYYYKKLQIQNSFEFLLKFLKLKSFIK